MSNAASSSPSLCWDPNLSPLAAELVCGYVDEYAPSPAPWSQETVCKYFVNALLADYVGLLFSDRVVSEDVKNDIIDLTTGIQKAFGSNLQNLTWLDATSRSSVVDKLQHIIQIIGHPNHLQKYEGVITTPDSLQTNFYAILEAVIRWNYNNLDHNRTDFEFPPLIVNAFYSPDTNTINFPAGILESPMFSATWPKLFQYARLGYVVGHENTHGFDNDGSHYGPDGLPKDIFDETTREKFNANTKCISDYYSTFRVYSNGTANVTVNGENTLGENIADIGGVKNSRRAYDDYVKVNGREFYDGELIPGFTTDQVFLIFQGQTWCSVTNDAYLKLQVEYDVHSPSKWRVNGPLSQEDEFATAFKCPLGSPMNPKNKCNVW